MLEDTVKKAREVLGQRIMTARRAHGVSVAVLAEGINEQAEIIIEIEAGTRRATVEQVLAIAAVLDQPEVTFLHGLDWPGSTHADETYRIVRFLTRKIA